MEFPIDLTKYHPLSFNLDVEQLHTDQKRKLEENIELARASIVFFTAFANTKGLGGHTGGAYDIIPELLIIDGFIKGNDSIYPVFFDEAGHRVAAQYMIAALNRHIKMDDLLYYREFNKGLYGHPEKKPDKGIFFSSGRLGHLWSHVNGIAEANPGKRIIMFGSDGSQQEGSDAEAARYAVAWNLNVKLFIDDNDVTIAGHPSEYMIGFDVAQTLEGHGLYVSIGEGEDIDALHNRIRKSLLQTGPQALINKRVMAPGVPGIEGSPKGHDVIPVQFAVDYLVAKGFYAAAEKLSESAPKPAVKARLGSSQERGKNRDEFGKLLCEIISSIKKPEEKFLVVDSDLEGSCGLHHIRKQFPEIYVHGGIMERNNFSVAAGFGSEPGKTGIFGTFAAFLEMVISEITMARLNQANVIAHFSHSGVDDMADNTCHFGINNFFADNGLPEYDLTRLYFPADPDQLKSILSKIIDDRGLRFIFSTRSATPYILKENGCRYFDDAYEFIPGKDDFIRKGKHGYIVSYGEMLYRCLDAVERLKQEGIDVGLVNKATLNLVDEAALSEYGSGEFLLVVESQNVKTGLGVRMGTWLIERNLTPSYSRMGTLREGRGGLSEQVNFQGLESEDIIKRVKSIIK